MQNVGRLLEPLLRWQVNGRLVGWWRLHARPQENLIRTSDQVAAVGRERSLTLAHVVPAAAEGVVGQVLHDEPGREVVAPHCNLVRVARNLRLFLDRLLELLRVEVLIDPADRLVGHPEMSKHLFVQLDQNIGQTLLAREDD